MINQEKVTLVTGGAGYIGSHTCAELLEAAYPVVVVDNLANSSAEALKRVQSITGKSLDFHQVDIRDEASLRSIFSQYSIDSVIHVCIRVESGIIANWPFQVQPRT